MCGDATQAIGDIAKAGKVAANAIPALARVFPGWTARSISKAESKNTDRMLGDLKKIKTSQHELGVSDESIAELMSDAVRRHSRNENFNAVLQLTSPMVDENANGSDVSPEWAEHFREHAEKVTDDDVRNTWARVLAGEINRPGSFSKRSMSILANMEKDDAEAFGDLCSACVLTVEGNTVELQPIPLLDADSDGASFNDGRFSYAKRSALETLGLIDSNVSFTIRVRPGSEIGFASNSKLTSVRNDGDSDIEIRKSPVFTKYGKELARLCRIGTMEKTDERVRSIAERHGLAVTSEHIISLDSVMGI